MERDTPVRQGRNASGSGAVPSFELDKFDYPFLSSVEWVNLDMYLVVTIVVVVAYVCLCCCQNKQSIETSITALGNYSNINSVCQTVETLVLLKLPEFQIRVPPYLTGAEIQTKTRKFELSLMQSYSSVLRTTYASISPLGLQGCFGSWLNFSFSAYTD